MLGEDKNLKDSDLSPTPLLDKERGEGVRWLSYTKTNKLIIALYMVTDIIDKEEPLRNKLRTLGTEIISDISSIPSQAGQKIIEIMSFLDIASAINLISEMNCNILKKEFLELERSIKEYGQKKSIWLEEFLPERQSIGHNKSSRTEPIRTRIGVQKGSTLLKALSGIKDMHKNNPILYKAEDFRSGFDSLKKQRRESILKIIKPRPSSSVDKPNGVSIKDIVLALRNLGEERGEKTLQRELASMVKDGVLYKTGEKRWSRYFIK